MPLIDLALVNNVWTLKLSMIQTVGLAVITLFIGTWINKHSQFLQRMCMPAPAVGALPFAFLTAILSYYKILKIKTSFHLLSLTNFMLISHFHFLLLPRLCSMDCCTKHSRYYDCQSVRY